MAGCVYAQPPEGEEAHRHTRSAEDRDAGVVATALNSSAEEAEGEQAGPKTSHVKEGWLPPSKNI